MKYLATALLLFALGCESLSHRPTHKCARWEVETSYGLRPGLGFNPFNGMRFEFGVQTYGTKTDTVCTRWVPRPPKRLAGYYECRIENGELVCLA